VAHAVGECDETTIHNTVLRWPSPTLSLSHHNPHISHHPPNHTSPPPAPTTTPHHHHTHLPHAIGLNLRDVLVAKYKALQPDPWPRFKVVTLTFIRLLTCPLTCPLIRPLTRPFIRPLIGGPSALTIHSHYALSLHVCTLSIGGPPACLCTHYTLSLCTLTTHSLYRWTSSSSSPGVTVLHTASTASASLRLCPL
jgi:hypothetical protein